VRIVASGAGLGGRVRAEIAPQATGLSRLHGGDFGLFQSAEGKKRWQLASFEREDVGVMRAKQGGDFVGGTVAPADPDYFRRVAEDKTPLVESASLETMTNPCRAA
jgi:hypothetical protein